ncbi:PH domain-containing protein [Schaalia sp. Marseille-Q2122]|uniref:PH domain-containing protein n=1 Tax=Schaalia sp. Marseille-Q2122 TaxID=2736604 RepID=UPI001589816A|nr:PH domain-containing protein [Schaalia sp. Marseille-Q2122]
MKDTSPTTSRAVDTGVPAEQWRRLHPVSPALNAWKALAALVAFLVYQNSQVIADLYSLGVAESFGLLTVVIIGGGSFLLVLVAIVLFSWLSWRNTTYALTPDALWFRKGIIFRSQRHARLDRIQAVDVVHPVLGRLFGLGQLHVEVAGGADSNFTFGYSASLATRESPRSRTQAAQPVSHCSQRRGHRHRRKRPPRAFRRATPHPAFAEAPERPLPGLGGHTHRILLRSTGVLIGALLTVAMVIVIIGLFLWKPNVAFAALPGLLPLVLGLISYLWNRFVGEFNFTAAVSADGIRIRRGLLETRSQTIPPRRIHAVHVVQPLLWRSRDWYRVRILQAGYVTGAESNGSTSQNSDVLLPVGTRQEAELALWLVVRDLGVDDPLAFIQEALHGVNATDNRYFHPNRPDTRWLDWVTWKRRAVALTQTVFAIRDGWFNRRMTIAPVERLQSMSIHEGPIERRYNLCSLHMEIVPGSVTAHAEHVDGALAAELMAQLLELSSQRRASEPPEKWMQRVTTALDGEKSAPASPDSEGHAP